MSHQDKPSRDRRASQKTFRPSGIVHLDTLHSGGVAKNDVAPESMVMSPALPLMVAWEATEAPSMQSESFSNPALVDVIIRVLSRMHGGSNGARAMLLEGVDLDYLCRQINYAHIDPHSYTLAAVTCPDFAIVPSLGGPVRTIQLRLCKWPAHPDTDLHNLEGVDLVTDTAVIPGTRRFLRLLPPSSGAETEPTTQATATISLPATPQQVALMRFLSEFRDTKKKAEALAAQLNANREDPNSSFYYVIERPRS